MTVVPASTPGLHRASVSPGLLSFHGEAGTTAPEGRTAEPQDLHSRLAERLSQFWPELSALGTAPFCGRGGMDDELLLAFPFGDEQLLIVRRRPHAPVPAAPPLSPRELAIARLVARGLPNKAIGNLLDISPWTVATHLRRIFGKLQVSSRAAMVASLTRQNLL